MQFTGSAPIFHYATLDTTCEGDHLPFLRRDEVDRHCWSLHDATRFKDSDQGMMYQIAGRNGRSFEKCRRKKNKL